MKIKIYSIFDSKSESYMAPSFLNANGQAIRAFTDAIQSAEHPFGKHPADYTLFHIGLYDDQTAKLTPLTPHNLGNGLEFLSTQPTNTEDMFHEPLKSVDADSPIQPNETSGNSAK